MLSFEEKIKSPDVLYDVDIWIPSNRHYLAKGAKRSLYPYKAKIYDGTGFESFSKLVNNCIHNSTKEYIIIVNDKSRACSIHVNKLLSILEAGYGLVSLYCFGFFGFSKELIRKIGFFDERFNNGGYEDHDFAFRMIEANIAFYESEEIPYIQMKSSWDYEKQKEFFYKKWNLENYELNRLLPELNYNYNIGVTKKDIDFLDRKESKVDKYVYYRLLKQINNNFVNKYKII